MSGVELWWLGQSGFRLTDPSEGPVVFVDPFLTPNDRRTWQAPITPEQMAAEADVVLVTHQHTDHFDQPSLRLAAAAPGSRFTLVVPTPIVEEARALGFSEERVIGAQPDSLVEAQGVLIHPVPACHGVNISDSYNFGEELSGGLVRYLGYVVEIGGARVYHAGDCIPYTGQADIVGELRPQLALLPINGRDYFRETERNLVGNMDFREAARLTRDIGAEALVPMHWELYPHNAGFPGDLVSYVEQFMPEVTVLTFGRAGRFTYVARIAEDT